MTDVQPPPARKQGLRLDDIVNAAIATADADGLDSLSMRRVADRLGHGVMSLYRHVEDKDHLVRLAIDAVFAEEPFPDPPPADWRGRMHESAHRQWHCYLRHPWIASVVSLARPALGANGMREMEWTFEGMQDLDITNSDRLRLYLVVTAYVHGAASQAAAESIEQRRTGLSVHEWWAAQAATLAPIFATGRYPLIAQLGPGANPSPAAWFEFGLERLLDGIEIQLESRSA